MWNHHQAAVDVEGARALGWTSLGIGLAELVAPRQVEELLGIDDRPSHRGNLRMLGVRELLHGVSILTEKRPNARLTAGVWSRVAGDALDTALLAIAATKTRRPTSFALVAAMVAGIGALDLLFASRLQRRQGW
jgi:hypothetical protein